MNDITLKEAIQEQFLVLKEYVELMLEDKEQFCTICLQKAFDECMKDIQRILNQLQKSMDEDQLPEKIINILQTLSQRFTYLLATVCFEEKLIETITTTDEMVTMTLLTNVVKKAYANIYGLIGGYTFILETRGDDEMRRRYYEEINQNDTCKSKKGTRSKKNGVNHLVCVGL